MLFFQENLTMKAEDPNCNILLWARIRFGGEFLCIQAMSEINEDKIVGKTDFIKNRSMLRPMQRVVCDSFESDLMIIL
jgi:hypothetical protein